MARIEGPSARRLIESISQKQVEAPTVDAPALPPPAPGLMGPLMPPPIEGSGFSEPKKKPVRMSGRFPPGPAIAPREPFPAFRMQPGVEAGTPKGSLQIKGSDAKAETAKLSPLNQAITKYGSMDATARKSVEKQILSGKLTDPTKVAAFLETAPSPAERAALMDKLPAKMLGPLKDLMRAGGAPDMVAVGVGVRMAAETKWGKDNPQVVETMKKAYAEGTMRLANEDANIAGLGMISDTGIDLGAQLRKSPEALAATIAHESVHKHEGGGACCSGKFDATPKGEISGNRATAAVWKELSPSGKDANLKPATRDLLNGLSNAKTDKDFQVKVVGAYVNFYQEKIGKLEKAVARGEAKLKAATRDKPMHDDDKAQLRQDRSDLADLRTKERQFQEEWKKIDPG